jgi:antitoxin MazE
MKTRIIRIGSRFAIRIPKRLLREAGLKDDVEIHVQKGSLVIVPAHRPRAGWKASFRDMAKRGDDAMLDGDAPHSTEWDKTEWEW